MKYPCRNGQAISPYELGFQTPSDTQQQTRRRTNNHHAYFSGAQYRDNRVHFIFRNLVTHIYPLLVEEHALLHEDYSPPPRPKEAMMVDIIDEYLATNGVVHCIRERQTRERYEIQAEDWQHIRNYGTIPRE